MKVWMVLNENSYGEDEFCGIFTSREKAELTIEAMRRFSGAPFDAYKIKEHVLDQEFISAMKELKQEHAELLKCETILKEMEEIMTWDELREL